MRDENRQIISAICLGGEDRLDRDRLYVSSVGASHQKPLFAEMIRAAIKPTAAYMLLLDDDDDDVRF